MLYFAFNFAAVISKIDIYHVYVFVFKRKGHIMHPIPSYLLPQNWIFGRKFKKGNSNLTVIETKIFIALTYYAVFGVVTMADFALFTANQDNHISEIQKYFVCEAKGSGSECDRSQFEGQRGWLHSLSYILLGLLPLISECHLCRQVEDCHTSLTKDHTKIFFLKKEVKAYRDEEED